MYMYIYIYIHIHVLIYICYMANDVHILRIKFILSCS